MDGEAIRNPIANIYYTIPNVIDPYLDSPFDMFEMKMILNSAKTTKVPGPDRISSEFYKNAPVNVLENMLAIFYEIFLLKQIPTSFNQAILIPLLKKGKLCRKL